MPTMDSTICELKCQTWVRLHNLVLVSTSVSALVILARQCRIYKMRCLANNFSMDTTLLLVRFRVI